MRIIRFKHFVQVIIVCLLLLPQSFANAEDSATSDAKVEFTPGMGPTFPVNPEDPSVVESGDPTVGSFGIVSVSNFDFDSLPVVSTNELYNIVTIMPNIQIVDLRGTSSGWKVKASVSRFENPSGFTLPGAAIHIIDGNPNSLSVSTAPEQIPNTVLTTDNTPTAVIIAEADTGTGHWIMRWYPSTPTGAYVKLGIPAGAATVGSHSATISWVLEDSP